MLVQFYLGTDIFKQPRWSGGQVVADFDDGTIDAARTAYEAWTGEPLPLDVRTGYPNFRVLGDDGTDIAGG